MDRPQTTPTPRRRVDLDEDTYALLERQARWYHVSVNALATLLIREGADADLAAMSRLRAMSPTAGAK